MKYGIQSCNFMGGGHNVMLIRINFECFNFVAASGVGACCLGQYADLNLEHTLSTCRCAAV